MVKIYEYFSVCVSLGVMLGSTQNLMLLFAQKSPVRLYNMSKIRYYNMLVGYIYICVFGTV